MYFWNDPYKNTFSFLSIVIQVVLKVHTSLQGRRNIGECVLSIYYAYDRYLFSLMAAEGWGENETCTKGVSDGQE